MMPEPLEPEISCLKWNESPGGPTVPQDPTCAIDDGSKSCTPAPGMGAPCLPASPAIESLPLSLSGVFGIPESSATVPEFVGGSTISVPAPPLTLVKDHAVTV